MHRELAGLLLIALAVAAGIILRRYGEPPGGEAKLPAEKAPDAGNVELGRRL